ncbi:hypothetical protein [uncultured Tateyamaria sp.]|uniref:hypothetical protein n=1 Tax=uncultured Tateyamaria sp. TaxID=455651 RepID=UPI00260DC839|nr:hypothetical protein [uncultured Tateyamaria sp.]
MILTFRLFVAFMLMAGVVHGAEIPVRSGAHENFVRIVLDIPKSKKWTLDQNTSGTTVTMENHGDGFDTSRVFNRIDRTYVSAITANSTSLSVKYGCKCNANIFQSGTMLVIDISELTNDSIENQPRIERSALQSLGSTRLQFTYKKPKEEPLASDLHSILDTTVSEQPSSLLAGEASQHTEVYSLQKAQEKLANRIGFAATIGVLRPSSLHTTIPLQPQRTQIDTSIFDSSLPSTEEAEQTEPLSGNLRITTSGDVPGITSENKNASTILGIRCIDPKDVRLQDWGTATDFAASIAMLRRELFSEFDKMNSTNAIELARIYLYFGFGAEAKQVLLMMDDLTPANKALIDIADVMEFGYALTENYLENFVDCDSDVALWAILSAQHLEPSASINSDAAIRTLSGLPIHLRSFLAPALSKKLLAYGDKGAAAAALRGLERTAEPLIGAAELARADIDLAQGEVTAAQSRLGEIVASNDQQSAEALIRYVDTHLDAGLEIKEDVATLVKAYAVEMRGDPLGKELRRTHVLALAKSDQFDKAFAALKYIQPSDGISETDALHSALISLLAEDADDTTFLEHAFIVMIEKPDSISAEATEALAQRLTDLGFFGEAEELMSTRLDIPNTQKNRILRARIALGMSQPHEAIAYLANTTGNFTNNLRAQASAEAGDHNIAHDLFLELDDDYGRRQSAWLSRNWQSLLDPSEPVLGPVALVASTTLESSPDPIDMLQRTNGALEESKKAREVIKKLLAANRFVDTQAD